MKTRRLGTVLHLKGKTIAITKGSGGAYIP